MGRRGFGISAISRLASAIRAGNARAERENLIAQSSSTEKELPTTYQLLDVTFDSETRLTTISIQSKKMYRTIDRYVTQDYVRYPVYSCWKTKITNLTKKIKLTNANLEHLNSHDDKLITQFAAEIILRIDNPDLIPSWLSKQIIENDYLASLKDYNIEISSLTNDYDKSVEDDNARIRVLNKRRNEYAEQESKITHKLEKTKRKLNYIDTHKASPIICILTFGIYAALFTKSRKNKLNAKLEIQSNILYQKQTDIKNIFTQIEKIKTEQTIRKNAMNSNISEIRKKVRALEKIRQEQLAQVTKLPTYVESSGFIPLKSFIGLEYEKIIGCYIIHNIEKDRYYVGQSKDIMRRIKQHFKGTMPNNIIFAEDYYNSQNSDKSNIFEIRIIQLETKDELDKTEAQLIEEYDANVTGYNSTRGNN